MSLQVCILVNFNEIFSNMFLPAFNRVIKTKNRDHEEKDKLMFGEIRKNALNNETNTNVV